MQECLSTRSRNWRWLPWNWWLFYWNFFFGTLFTNAYFLQFFLIFRVITFDWNSTHITNYNSTVNTTILSKKNLKKTLSPLFFGWDSTASRLQNHYQETVYFLPQVSRIIGTHLINIGPVVLNLRLLDWESSALTTWQLLLSIF